MRTSRSILRIAIAAALGLGVPGPAPAQEGHDHGATPHGGTEATTGHYHFEVVFAKDGVTLYARGADHSALDASRLGATATFYHPSSPSPWFTRPLKPAGSSPGQPAPALVLTMDLGTVPPHGARVAFEVTSLPDPAEPTATFTVPFALSQPGAITVAQATPADQAAIDAQKVCPISGEELGSMGPPLKVSRGDRTIFLCCKGCLKKVQANPDKFFGAPSAPATPEGEHDRQGQAP